MLTKQILRVMNHMRINRSVALYIQSAVSLNVSLKANSRKVSLQEEAFCVVESHGPSAVQNSVRYEMWTLFIVPQQINQSSSLNTLKCNVFHLLFQYPFEENLFQSLFYPLQTKFLDTVNTLCGRIPQVFLKQIEKTMRAVYEKKVVRHVRLPRE